MWKRFSTSSPSSTADGSSITISRASRDSALATDTICLPAADSVPTSLARRDLRMSQSHQQLSRPAPGRRALREARPGQLVTEEDVLPDREPVHQVEFLIDGGDALLQRGDRRAQRRGLAQPEHLAGVDRVRPGQHLDQRGLPGAVLPEQAVHLAGADLQVHPVQRAHAGENLDDAAHFQQRRDGVVFVDLGHAVTVATLSYVGQAKPR